MFELISLGFLEEEIHLASLNEKGQFYIPAQWHGDRGYFMVGTSVLADVSLNSAGVRSGNLPLLRSEARYDIHRSEAFTLLGKTRAAGEIAAIRTSEKGTIFGTIGSRFFGEETVALDPAGPYVALTTREWVPPEPSGFFTLPLIGKSVLPLTAAVRFEADPALEHNALLSTDFVQSYVSRTVADALPKRSVGSGRVSTLSFPNASTREVVFDVKESMSAYETEHAIGSVLGLDVLVGFLTVLQLGERRAYLQPYGRAT